MRFEAEPAVVFVGEKRGYLSLPVDVPGAGRSPDRLGSFHMAILHMHVRNAAFGNQIIPIGKRILACYERVRRIPNELQVGMIHRLQHRNGFRSRAEITGVLVFEADDEPFFCGFVGQVG